MEPSDATFGHPYQPYDIQSLFMRNLYKVIEEKKIGIFESPTGTGKSLSLICGALTWLRDNARREIDTNCSLETDDLQDDWLVAAERVNRKKEVLQDLAEREQILSAIREQQISRHQAAKHSRSAKKRIDLGTSRSMQNGNDDEEFLVDDYLDNDEVLTTAGTTAALSSSTLALLEKLKPAVQEDVKSEAQAIQIIFCSRTHSQLTQFVGELRKVKPPSVFLPNEAITGSSVTEQQVKHLALGSRKNLCINKEVLRFSSTLAINERCLELQKPGTVKDRKCQFLPGKTDKDRVNLFKDHAVATIRDIEDLGQLGRKMQLCPYYASRPAIPSSEVLTLPYPLLLQKTAREALGVRVENSVVIIDEAHNLVDAIADTLSVSLTITQIESATDQVFAYAQRFKAKLKGANRMYITQMIRLLRSIADCLRSISASITLDGKVVTASELMIGKGVDQIKPHELLKYLVQSKLAYKVEGYHDARDENEPKIRSRGVLMNFHNFLAVLMNPDAEGRFFVTKQGDDILVRYTLLDPTEHFRDIAQKARSVILAGGTMAPMSDYIDHLFSYLDPERLEIFSFGHIVSKDNIFVGPVAYGPRNVQFDFTYGKRDDESMIIELGNALTEICYRVPDGIVVFFPSYDYIATVCRIWDRSPSQKSIMTNLASVKECFRETRETSADELLFEYSKAVDTGKGAILLSVVGGKLSEGINFSDNLGRAVVAVGLPFPNAQSAEWKAKIEHVEQAKYRKCIERENVSESVAKQQSRTAGKDYYENACMRAINQSIGRAIRHKNDYAAILLVDKRFATVRIQSKLPQWIRGSMKEGENTSWTAMRDNLQQFFQYR